MRRRVSSTFLVTVGLLLALLAGCGWTIEVSVLNRARLQAQAGRILATNTGSDAMAGRVATAIGAALPDNAGVDPVSIQQVARKAIKDPRFVGAFATVLGRVHDRVVDGRIVTYTLDPAAVSAAVSDAGRRVDPSLAVFLGSAAGVSVAVPSSEVPDMAAWVRWMKTAADALGALALVLGALGVWAAEHRATVVGRVGRWIVIFGLATIVGWWAVPTYGLSHLDGWVDVIGAVMDAGRFLVTAGLLLVAAGLTVTIVANNWTVRGRRRVLSSLPHAPGRHSLWDNPV